MKQVLQHARAGTIVLADVAVPACPADGIVVRNHASVVSVGTERAMVQFAKRNLLDKARSRPELVRQVLASIRTDGVVATVNRVRRRLDAYHPLGYACAGVVEESSTPAFRVGDRVACGGVGYAAHAELVPVPRHLAVPVPDGVALWAAAFTTIGAIALHGIRQADIHVGESVGVIGLGLVGQLTCQLLRAAGCRAYGFDIDAWRVELARGRGFAHCGVPDSATAARVQASTDGHGLDAVVIAAAGDSNAAIELAAALARDRARIVAVGAVGLTVPRGLFYAKELSLHLSRSYGPGRYDRSYEEGGSDYPIGYVRWTENRNMREFVQLLADRTVILDDLVTHRVALADACEAYERLSCPNGERFVGVVVEYPAASVTVRPPPVSLPRSPSPRSIAGAIRVGVIGAGRFAQELLIPNFPRELPIALEAVATSSPPSAYAVARRFGFRRATCRPEEIAADPDLDLVLVATPHAHHASQVVQLLRANKRVFVEKPLALTAAELAEVEEACRASAAPFLMVGYNRRFSPAVAQIKRVFGDEPLQMVYRVNAGRPPVDGWVGDSSQGGRILGEAGHFIDVMQFLTDSIPVAVTAHALDSGTPPDDVTASVEFADGSLGTLLYSGRGSGAGRLGKEYLEVHGGGATAVLDDFATVRLYHGARMERVTVKGKGHREEMRALFASVAGNGPPPIALESLLLTSRATLAILESATARGARVPLGGRH